MSVWIQVCDKGCPHSSCHLPKLQAGRVSSERCHGLYRIGKYKRNLSLNISIDLKYQVSIFKMGLTSAKCCTPIVVDVFSAATSQR